MIKPYEFTDLPNIIDNIVAAEDLPLSKEETNDFIETCMSLMYDYIDSNPTAISEPDFHDDMMDDILDIIFRQDDSFQTAYWTSNGYVISGNINIELYEDLIEYASDLFYQYVIPPRSYGDDDIDIATITIKEKVDKIKAIPQPQQRTPEWYQFRHNLITASNAYKAFESVSAQNQLIYEKCQPLTESSLDSAPVGPTVGSSATLGSSPNAAQNTFN